MSPELRGDGALLGDDAASVATRSSEIVFHGHVWDIRKDVFDYNGVELSRDFVDHTGAVAVLALDEQGRVLLIKQYRHPIGYRDWEIPAGLLDVRGESALTAAQRELAEEADLMASEWGVLSEFWTSPGGSNEAIRVYLARGLAATAQPFPRSEEEADIETRWVELDEIVEAVLARRVQNPILAHAALAAQISRARGWATLGSAEEPWVRHPKLGA